MTEVDKKIKKFFNYNLLTWDITLKHLAVNVQYGVFTGCPENIFCVFISQIANDVFMFKISIMCTMKRTINTFVIYLILTTTYEY